MLLEQILRLPPDEQEALREVHDIAIRGSHTEYDQLAVAEYVRRPVSVETFLTDPYFLGESGNSLWPKLRADMIELFEGDYYEGVLGGCLALDSLIAGANGSIRPLGEIIGHADSVLTLHPDRGCVSSKAGKAVLSGTRQVVRLTLANGARLEMTPDHRVLVADENGHKWKQAGSLLVSDMVVVPRRLRVTPDLRTTEAEAKLLAYWCADGSSDEYRARFCDGNPETSSEVLLLLEELGFSGTRYPKGENCWEVHTSKSKTSGFIRWLRDKGADLKTKDVRVPDAVCRAEDHVVVAFLNRLWACEGTVYASENGKSPPRIQIGMTSELFIRQLQVLLLRFGIRARVSNATWKDKRRNTKSVGWLLVVSGAEQIGRFVVEIGPILGKEDSSARVLSYSQRTLSNTNVDVMPFTSTWLSKRMTQDGIRRSRGSHWWKLATYKSRVSRKTFDEWLVAFGDSDLGQKLANEFHEDLGYERVVSVNSVLTRVMTGDVTDVVEGTRYIAGGMLVHNSIGWGKSFFATCAMAYTLYQMSCLRNPQKTYGIDSGSSIYVAMLSVTEKVARRVAVNELVGKIEHSRYFKEHFPLKAAPSQLEIKFPNSVQVVAGSTGSSAVIGLNVFAGFIDESSFMGDSKEVDRSGKFIAADNGEKIYKSIIRRMKSRFQRAGRMPGVLLTVSSKERPGAFIEKRIREAREQDDKHFFVREYATWDVKPADFFSPGTFKVVAGNDKIQSRILTSGDPKEEERYRDMGLQVIEVPVDYRADFERDIDGSLRDVAGIATESVSPFMQRTDTIFEAADPSLPLATRDEDGNKIEEWVANRPLQIFWQGIAQQFERRLTGGFVEVGWRPLRHPNAIRYAHIDASLTGDATGLVIAHVSNWTEVVRRDFGGDEYTELAPVLETDLLLRIIPPPGDEILLSDVRNIIYQFIEHGFQIGYISMDQYQSADSLQQFRKRGIEAELVSMDRTTEAYDTLKGAFYEKRIRTQQHNYLAIELRNLQRVPTSGGRVKIDHPKLMTGADGNQVRGTKDVADALAGVVWSISQRSPGRPIPPMLGGSDSGGTGDRREDSSWVTGGAVMVGEGVTARGSVTKPVGPGGTPLPFVKG